ncbi:unnamed protein product, partial [Porites lobata]
RRWKTRLPSPKSCLSWNNCLLLRRDEKGNLKLEDVGSSAGSDDPREQVRHHIL